MRTIEARLVRSGDRIQYRSKMGKIYRMRVDSANPDGTDPSKVSIVGFNNPTKNVETIKVRYSDHVKLEVK